MLCILHCVLFLLAWYKYLIFLFYTQNIIHCDLKPDNLLVTSTGNVKIGDFSVSQIFEVVCLSCDFVYSSKIYSHCQGKAFELNEPQKR